MTRERGEQQLLGGAVTGRQRRAAK